MTTITFKRCGGFVGKGMRYQLRLDEMPGNDASALLHLIQQAEFFNIPENLIVKFNPDEYQYTITVDAGGDLSYRPHERHDNACFTPPVGG
jgi:hypothetical protein